MKEKRLWDPVKCRRWRFLKKCLTDKISLLFSQRSSVVDVWQDPKYTSERM